MFFFFFKITLRVLYQKPLLCNFRSSQPHLTLALATIVATSFTQVKPDSVSSHAYAKCLLPPIPLTMRHGMV